MTLRKYKVAIICHFSSKQIQEYLPLKKTVAPYAQWIENVIEALKIYQEFEIHIIAPHEYLGRSVAFNKDGINFHFFRIGIPILNRRWPFFFDVDVFTNNYFNSKSIIKIVDSIKPDLINLHGFENPRYAASILKLHPIYPVLVTIQGFCGLSLKEKRSLKTRYKAKNENRIIKKCDLFCGDHDSMNIIAQTKGHNNFRYFKFFYPVSYYTEKYNNQTEKRYEILFWGRIDRDKGIEDFVRLTAKIKSLRGRVNSCIIGPATVGNARHLKEYALKLGCLDSMEFKGFITNQEELYKNVIQSKILVVPSYNDRLPTVIREAMFLKIAVVSYAVGGIPYINEGEEHLKLIEVGNEEALFLGVIDLLENPNNYNRLVLNARRYAEVTFSLSTAGEDLANIYRKVIE